MTGLHKSKAKNSVPRSGTEFLYHRKLLSHKTLLSIVKWNRKETGESPATQLQNYKKSPKIVWTNHACFDIL